MNYIYNFLPKQYIYLTKINKIEYNDINLKTDYIINIMHELIIKYYFTNEITYNLWSTLLRKKYGKYYNKYIKYLLDIKFMRLTSNYYVGKKAKSYTLNITSLDIIRYKVKDKFLLAKYKKNFIFDNFTTIQDSPINLDLRKALVDDLYHVELDYDRAKKYLKTIKKEDLNKYLKNLSAIDGVKTGHIFFKFDAFGRLHTNFTVLKRFIRHNCLTIDNQVLTEIDIKNSQPLFFSILLKNEIGENNFNTEVKDFVDIVKNGLIYDKLLGKFPEKIKSRNQAKLLMYKVLFGRNNISNIENKLFQSLYPTIFDYINDMKEDAKSYKILSHKLQKLESEFIFNNVVSTIKEKFPHIKLFTVHDSIVFPEKYKEEVSIIFNSFLNNLI